MAERESQPQETTPAGGEEGSGVGGGVQERGDQASRRPGPKKRPERLSQLSLAQFLFLLDPASLPGGALPLVEKQPRECSQLLHSRQGAPPGRASPPPPPPQGAALGPRPPLPHSRSGRSLAVPLLQ